MLNVLKFMGSSHVLSGRLTAHEARDRSAGHRPGQLAIKRVHHGVLLGDLRQREAAYRRALMILDVPD